MDKYTLIYSRHADFDDGVTRSVVRIVVDTMSDLPDPDAKWAPGSTAIICDESKTMMLNNKMTWVEVDDRCGTANTYTAEEIDEKLAKISSGGADVASDDEVTDMLEEIFGQ